MKKTLLTLVILSYIGIAQAEYIMQIPLEQTKGGGLPNGSINITAKPPSLPTEKWVTAEPIETVKVNQGEIYGCTNWTPSTSIYFKDSSFTQNATDCKQDQMSTKQNREQETTTLAYRNVGDPINVTNTLMVKSSRTTIGTADCLYRLNSGGLPNIYWQSGKDSSANTYVIYVNGSQLKADVGYSINTVTVNGVTYTRGTTVRYTGTATNGAIYLFYDVCK